MLLGVPFGLLQNVVIDEDSYLYKALIKGGADEEAFLEGDYKGFLDGVNKTDDTAKFLKQALNFSKGDNEGLGFIPSKVPKYLKIFTPVNIKCTKIFNTSQHHKYQNI